MLASSCHTPPEPLLSSRSSKTRRSSRIQVDRRLRRHRVPAWQGSSSYSNNRTEQLQIDTVRRVWPMKLCRRLEFPGAVRAGEAPPPDGATQRMNEDLLTGCDVSGAVQHLIGRDPVEDQGDSSLSVYSFGHAYQIFFWKIDQFSLSLVLRKTCDAIADLEL